MFRDAALIAGKDLRIEARSRVATNQIAPFAVLVLILFAFALDPDRGILARATAGLFWITVLFCALLAIQRGFSIESADGNRDALRLTSLDPAGIFLGKAGAIALELLGLEVLLLIGVVVLYDACCARQRRTAGAHDRHRDRRSRGRRYPLRRPRRRAQGSGDLASPAPAPSGGAGAHRGHEGVRGGARRLALRGLAVGRPPRRLRPRLHGARARCLRTAPRGVVCSTSRLRRPAAPGR